MKKCWMCGKEYGWQEWGKYIYKNSNICYACHSSVPIKGNRICACGKIYNQPQGKQPPCVFCKVIDENHHFFCSWCGRKLH